MKRANRIALSVTAVFTLLVAAVSACACSHHELQAVAEQSSCHSAAHAEPGVRDAEAALTEVLSSDCSCFINTRVPAMNAKGESKQASEKRSAAAVSREKASQLVRQIHIAVTLRPEDTEFHVPRTSFSSGPSRAPPRH